MFRFSIVLLLLYSCWLSGSNIYAESEIPQKCKQATMVDSFLYGLQAEVPKQAVELWILGVKNRSGAVQFATLSPTLQKKTKDQFEKKGWGTGQSSPWVDNVCFVKEEKMDNGKVRYTIEYDLITSNWKWNKKGQKMITVEKNPNQLFGHWYITEITTLYNEWEAFTPAETVIQR